MLVFAVGLVGGRVATAEVLVDPSALNHRDGDVVTGNARRALDEFWADTATEAAGWRTGLTDLERQVTSAGGPEQYVHRTLWQVLREVSPPLASAEGSPVEGSPAAGHRSVVHGPSRRYVRAVELGPADAADAAAGDPNRRTIMVRDGKVSARLPRTGQYRPPPRFAGRLEQRAGGRALVGTIRESWGSTVFSRGYLFVAVLMAFTLAFGIGVWISDSRHDGLPPTLIGLIATPVFAVLWISFRRSRRPDFERDADELEASLTSSARCGAVRSSQAGPLAGTLTAKPAVRPPRSNARSCR